MNPVAQRESHEHTDHADHYRATMDEADAACGKMSQEVLTTTNSRRPKAAPDVKGQSPGSLDIPPISGDKSDNHSGMPGHSARIHDAADRPFSPAPDQNKNQLPKGVKDAPLDDEQKALKNASPSEALKAAESLLGQGADSYPNIKIAQDYAKGSAAVKQELVNLAGSKELTGDKSQVVAYMTENAAFRGYEKTLTSDLPK